MTSSTTVVVQILKTLIDPLEFGGVGNQVGGAEETATSFTRHKPMAH